MTSATEYFDMKAAPLRIGTVRLKVRDLDAVSAFYKAVLGLSPIETGDRRVTLGKGTMPLLELEGDPALAPHDPRQAGLFHTAFLMPTRADLARWVAHVSEAGVPLQGASDHIVSEALYLADPEGNGMEVYVDRPVARWHDTNGEIRMSTDPLDVPDLLKGAEGTTWSGFPEGGSIGHVHLQVGDTGEADRFYRDVLGLEIAARYPGASFYGSGGYHHQLAGNVWNSRRAGMRPEGMAGLAEVILRADPAQREAIIARAGGDRLKDPWGTRFIITE